MASKNQGYRVVQIRRAVSHDYRVPMSRWISKDQAVAFAAGVKRRAESDEVYAVESRRGVLSSIGKGQVRA